MAKKKEAVVEEAPINVTPIHWLPDHTTGLKFVHRDGKNLLQQKWLGYRYGVAMEEEWRDVPMDTPEDN